MSESDGEQSSWDSTVVKLSVGIDPVVSQQRRLKKFNARLGIEDEVCVSTQDVCSHRDAFLLICQVVNTAVRTRFDA